MKSNKFWDIVTWVTLLLVAFVLVFGMIAKGETYFTQDSICSLTRSGFTIENVQCVVTSSGERGPWRVAFDLSGYVKYLYENDISNYFLPPVTVQASVKTEALSSGAQSVDVLSWGYFTITPKNKSDQKNYSSDYWARVKNGHPQFQVKTKTISSWTVGDLLVFEVR